jgi:hypothetical protein
MPGEKKDAGNSKEKLGERARETGLNTRKHKRNGAGRSEKNSIK